MIDPDIHELLNLARSAVRFTATHPVISRLRGDKSRYRYELSGREVKLELDAVLSDALTTKLAPSRIQVISEEDSTTHEIKDEYVWLIDPLDGSLNWLRDCGPSAVSCALMRLNEPVFGVIQQLNSPSLFWGGESLGAFVDDSPIAVSTVSSLSDAVVCTGIPARLNTSDEGALAPILSLLTRAQKVRMIGSAASSLILVARGSVDLYSEQSVMPWDVAAGLAIVAGAGGRWIGNDFSRSNPVTVVSGAQALVNACIRDLKL